MIDKRYKIIEKLGEGGIGVVYRARDSVLREDVAVKVLSNRASGDSIKRFQVEARAAGKLNHKNIARVLDFGISDDSQPYLVMSYLKGRSLAAFLKGKAGLNAAEVLPIFSQICDGLAHAHDKGILHRDIKPSNIMLIEEGSELTVKIIDFGLAKMIESNQTLTAKGLALGSPPYMSPEQIQNSELDERSDLYSLGCLMYQALSGTTPYRGRNAAETMSLHLDGEAKELDEVAPHVSQKLSRVIMRCLSKNKDDRFRTAAELNDSLKSVTEKISEGAAPATSRNENRIGNKLVALTFSTAVVLLGVLIAGVLNHESLFQMLYPSPTTVPDSEGNHSSSEQDEHVSLSAPEEKGHFQRLTSKPYSVRGYSVTDEQLKECRTFTGVTELNLEVSDVTGSGLKYLSEARWLESLRLVGIPVTDEYLADVAKITSLKRLVLDKVHSIKGPGVKHLTMLPRLYYVSLDSSTVTDTTLENLGKCKSLTSLNLSRAIGVTDKGLAALSRSTSLDQLNLTECGIDDEKLKIISRMRITELNLSDNLKITDESLQILWTMKRLVHLQLLGCENTTKSQRIVLASKLKLKASNEFYKLLKP